MLNKYTMLGRSPSSSWRKNKPDTRHSPLSPSRPSHGTSDRSCTKALLSIDRIRDTVFGRVFGYFQRTQPNILARMFWNWIIQLILRSSPHVNKRKDILRDSSDFFATFNLPRKSANFRCTRSDSRVSEVLRGAYHRVQNGRSEEFEAGTSHPWRGCGRTSTKRPR